MKKTVLLFLALAAFFVLPNASVWEGSGTVAPSGSLPDEGYYAATNSFPRNTVVDITNLETGKSIRVIVASGLDAPGLLAVISRDAAVSIGLQPRSIGRIRMIQPSDPIAFSRFTEGLSSSGDPDYDPSALLNSEVSPEKTPEIAEESASDAEKPAAEGSAPAIIAETPSALLNSEVSPEKTPEIAEESASDAEKPAAEGSVTAIIAETPSPAEEETKAADGVSPYAGEDPDRNFPAASEIVDAPETSPEETREAAESGSGLFLASPVPAEEEETPREAAGIPVETTEAKPESPAQTAGEGAYNSISLVPAESRPPQDETVWSLPPEAEVEPLREHGAESSFAMAEAAPPAEKPAPSSDYIDESLVVDPLQPHQEDPPPQALMEEYLFVDSVKPQQTETPRQDVMDSDDFVSSSQQAAEDTESYSPEPVEPLHGFSVPLVASLEKGKYYLQLGAFSRPESVESAIAAIDKTYPLAVQSGGNGEKTLYRILVGPLNLGESAAALQRFKGSGYKDAFVRKIGD
jgi:hypothetical protein